MNNAPLSGQGLSEAFCNPHGQDAIMADQDKKIRLSSPNSLSNNFLFLIDTGAAVSLVKIEKINKLHTFYDIKNHQINLKGIGNDQLQTYGKV